MQSEAICSVGGESVVQLNHALTKVDGMSGETGLNKNNLDGIGISDVVGKIVCSELEIEVLATIRERSWDTRWLWATLVVVPRVEALSTIFGGEDGVGAVIRMRIAASNKDGAIGQQSSGRVIHARDDGILESDTRPTGSGWP